jgi:hypothetical protein
VGRSLQKTKIIAMLALLFMGGYGCMASGNDERGISSYQFLASLNSALSTDVTAVISGTGITATVPVGTDVTALIASFESVGGGAAVAGTTQVSGESANDFTDPVTYTAAASDGATTDYAVLVTDGSDAGSATIKYVDGAGGSDTTGDGTRSFPYATISKAIESAAEGGGNVRVAKGVYNVSEAIVMVEGVSIYGGYDPENWSRDIENNSTSIADTRTSGGLQYSPISVVTATGEVSSATIIDGFAMSAALGASVVNDNVAAIFINDGASPTISHNVITGGSGFRSYGILVFRGNPTIHGNAIVSCAESGGINGSGAIVLIYTSEIITDNIIEACSRGEETAGVTAANSTGFIERNTIVGGNGESSIGIQLADSTTIVNNNVVDGGGGNTSSMGVFSLESTPYISNNTIFGGDGSSDISAIQLRGVGEAVISNNILFGTGAAGYGITLGDVSAIPGEVKNNDIFNCGDGVYDRMALAVHTVCDNIACMETALDAIGGVGTASSNIEEALVLDSEYRITTAPDPISVTEGGLDLSSPDAPAVPILVDRDGNPRIVPYSMGAFQYD